MSECMADISEESNIDTESDGIGLGKYKDLLIGITTNIEITLMGIMTQRQMKMMMILRF